VKRVEFGLTILIIAAAAGFAAAPWSDMHSPQGDGYSEQMGAALPYSAEDLANPSNCYDACAAIWGRFIDGSDAKVAGGEVLVSHSDDRPSL
jgi:predicted lipoprotein with Yx(FWY)xxD motif